jgi:4'-phosphopantetheinyl transferase
MSETMTWFAAPPDLRLEPNEIHLWRADLDQSPPILEQLSQLLNEQEQARSQKFVRAKDANRFAATHGILRHILSRYLRVVPQNIEFTVAALGKPALRNDPKLHFNLADSGDLVVYAISGGRELGVDVERHREEFVGREIVQRYFSKAEQTEYFALDSAFQKEAFYLGWTRKEAYIKARGEGLHADLKSFDVSLTPKKPFLLTSEDADRWSRYSFCPKPGYAAALVVEGKELDIRHWQWEADETLLHF